MEGKKRKRLLISVIVLVVIVSGIGLYNFLQPEPEKHHLSGTEFLMDTVVDIDIYTEDEEKGQQALDKTYSVMKDWSDKVDRHLSGSIVYQLNETNDKLEVPGGLITMLEESKYYYEKSDGSFDPTVTPLLKLWGFGEDEQQVPETEEIEQILDKIDFGKVKVDSENNTVQVPEEIELDLGAVAKGFIVDKGVETLKEEGIDSALINAGGNIGVVGEKPDGPWRLGLKNARSDGQEIFGDYIVGLSKGGLATSGDYERYFEEDGVRYSHLIDARTGHQVREMRSATIYAPTALEADILSTTVFLMGWEEGQSLIKEEDNVEGFLVRDDDLWYSDGFAELFQD
ncbi:MAG: FAD:protein FMN transferase [Bacillota bacterium]